MFKIILCEILECNLPKKVLRKFLKKFSNFFQCFAVLPYGSKDLRISLIDVGSHIPTYFNRKQH